MLRTHALETVRQEQDEPREPFPLVLRTHDELIDDHLRGVHEVAELRLPQHEPVRIIEAIAPFETEHGGHCGHCNSCRRGEFFACQVALKITGISFDGGYAEYMVAPDVALASVPDDLKPAEAAPLIVERRTFHERNVSARTSR